MLFWPNYRWKGLFLRRYSQFNRPYLWKELRCFIPKEHCQFTFRLPPQVTSFIVQLTLALPSTTLSDRSYWVSASVEFTSKGLLLLYLHAESKSLSIYTLFQRGLPLLQQKCLTNPLHWKTRFCRDKKDAAAKTVLSHTALRVFAML